MKQKVKTNIMISSTAMIASFLAFFYLMFVMPEKIELILTFGFIILVDGYFLIDSILKKVDELSLSSLDKQTEMTKVQKGIYSVTKREELSLNQRLDAMQQTIESLKEENAKLTNELMEQQKLYLKLIIKKNQENMVRVVNSNDRITKQVVQMSGDNKIASNETNETLSEIYRSLTEDKNASKVTRMPSQRAE